MVRIVGYSMLASLVAVSAFACGYDSPAAPVPAPLTVSGRWSGQGSDVQGNATFILTLTQTGSSVTGTAVTLGDANDGSCASCHKSTNGTVSGSLTGTKLTLSMFFPSGNDGVPTPMCSVRMSAVADSVSARTLRATYTGDDSCEGPITGGSFSLTNAPTLARSP